MVDKTADKYAEQQISRANLKAKPEVANKQNGSKRIARRRSVSQPKFLAFAEVVNAVP
jgi:hypothetical protein